MTGYFTEARIELGNSPAFISRIGDHLKLYGAELSRWDNALDASTELWTSSFESETDSLLVRAEASSLDMLYLVKMTIAEQIMQFVGNEAFRIAWTGDGSDLTVPPNFSVMEVASVRDVTPHMRRITLRGDDLSRFDTLEALHLRILVQHPEAPTPQWPTLDPNGIVRWPDGEHRPRLRVYTVRNVDVAAGTMDLDFVLHGDAHTEGGPGTAPGADWARHAAIGQPMGIIGPGGGGLKEADWYLFAGDETGLPAIGRMLEALPPQARGHVIVEVADAGEEQALAAPQGFEIRWLHRNGAEAGTTTQLADAVKGVSFPRDGREIYAWAACEFDAFRAIRTYLRKEVKLSRADHLVVSYWRRGRSEEESGGHHDD